MRLELYYAHYKFSFFLVSASTQQMGELVNDTGRQKTPHER